MSLTKRQEEVLMFVRQYHAANGIMPTVREIAAAFDIKSPNGVRCHLMALQAKGELKGLGNAKARSMQLAGPGPNELLREAAKRLVAREFNAADIELAQRIKEYLGEQ